MIRPAQAADVPAMSRVLVDSITQLCGADHHGDPEKLAAWTRNKSREGVAAMLGNAEMVVLVAERDAGIVAVGAVTTGGEIALNYVSPEARFTGASKAMLAALETELVALGFDEGRLEATATARRFYKRAGWSAEGPQVTGRKVNGFPMRKRLACSSR